MYPTQDISLAETKELFYIYTENTSLGRYTAGIVLHNVTVVVILGIVQ